MRRARASVLRSNGRRMSLAGLFLRGLLRLTEVDMFHLTAVHRNVHVRDAGLDEHVVRPANTIESVTF